MVVMLCQNHCLSFQDNVFISRCASLSQVNSMLREQLDQAGALNRELAESLWMAQEELVLCETRLQREQKVGKSPKTDGES